MSQRPWMPFYVADHVADTLHLGTLEHGAYMLLLLQYWRRGPLPDCDADLRRITRLSAGQWRKARDTLRAFFTSDNGVLRHARLDAEISRADTMIAEKSQRGRAAAQARWHAPGNADASPLACPADAQPQSQQQSPLPEQEQNNSLSDKSDGDVPKIKSARKNYPEEFQSFWRDYPTDPVMSKCRAFVQWRRLSREDQRAAHAAVPGFRAYCGRNPNYRPVHAERYLGQRRFDGFAAPAAIAIAPELYRDVWNGAAAPLVEAVGAAEFSTWFLDAVFRPGPPARMTVSSAFRRDHIEGKFGPLLRQLFGDIKLECKA